MCPKKEANMKMILGVLVVRMIISLFDKNDTHTRNEQENRNTVIHPAEFQVR